MNWEDYINKQIPKEIQSDIKTFLLPTEDSCIHIIKTGFSERRNYLVVYEDAYQQLLGKTEMMSATEIKESFE